MSVKRVTQIAASLIAEMSDKQDQTVMLQMIHSLLIEVQHTPSGEIDKLLMKIEALADES